MTPHELIAHLIAYSHTYGADAAHWESLGIEHRARYNQGKADAFITAADWLTQVLALDDLDSELR